MKDYDFVIGAIINAEFKCKGEGSGDSQRFDMPAIAIECKTYLDKTMLESCSTTGEQLKKNDTNALYIVVCVRPFFCRLPCPAVAYHMLSCSSLLQIYATKSDRTQ